jgi:hypothetical protein
MASTVNAAISGLLAALAASDDLTGVVLHDGPPAVAESLDWIAVGYQPGSTESVTMTYDWAQIGGQRSEETYDILCSFAAHTGDADMSLRRARAITIRDAIAAAVSADRTLGGAVRLAYVSEAVMHQEQTSRGAAIGFTFTLSCAARITT